MHQITLTSFSLNPEKWIFGEVSLRPVTIWGTAVRNYVDRKPHVIIQRMRQRACYTALNQRHQPRQEQNHASVQSQIRRKGKVALSVVFFMWLFVRDTLLVTVTHILNILTGMRKKQNQSWMNLS